MVQDVLNNRETQPSASSSHPTAASPIQPWYWRSLPLHQRTGSDVFQALYVDVHTMMPKEAIATLLESPAISQIPEHSNIPTPRYSICAGSPRILDDLPQCWTPSTGNHLDTLRILLSRFPASPNPLSSLNSRVAERRLTCAALTPPDHLPFHGGWLGWLGYDVAWDIEVLPQKNVDPLPFPVSFWYEPDTFAVLDHQDQFLWLAATHPADLDRLQNCLSLMSPTAQQIVNRDNARTLSPNIAAPALTFLSPQQDYEAAVKRAKEYIRAGDIFQTNLSLRFSTDTPAHSWMIYQALQQVNPSPFSSYWHTPWGDVVSCSPERLVKVRDRIAETRPIAGTRPRGKTSAQDLAYEQELTGNRKENAEHIMLVDLERNDLGRVCEWGTVKVDELLTIERYSHVMHLVSNVVGTLAPDQTVVDAVQSLFPGGTITGCPKVRCMEIIEELEPVRRSLFYGSCGYLDQRGMLDLNILIRTLLCEPSSNHAQTSRTVWGQVGAGIVADSQPTHEWLESLNKAKAQLSALTLAHQFHASERS